jgi:replicative DNA helicase
MTNPTNPFLTLRNEDAERAVLGDFLSSDERFELNPVKIAHFANEKNRRIFEAILEAKRSGARSDDLVTVADKGKKRKIAASDLAELCTEATFTNTEANIKVLEKYAIYRRVYAELDALARDTLDIPDEPIEFLERMNSALIGVLDEFQDTKSADIKDIITRLEETRESFRTTDSIMNTGFDILDRMTGGLIPRFVWIVGAQSNAGKSFFSLQMALNVLKQKKKVLVFSLEMSDLINASRLVGNLGGIGGIEVYQGSINDERYTHARDALKEYQLSVFDDKMTMDAITASCMKESAKGHVDFIVIDYVQNLMGDKGVSSYENMVNAMKSANIIAQRTNCSILLVSQMSNESLRTTGNSKVIGYKGAGELTAGPDVGLVLERVLDDFSTSKEVDKETILCRIAKNRHGPVGKFWLHIDPASGQIIQHHDQIGCDQNFKTF